jgi:hypothetical protein
VQDDLKVRVLRQASVDNLAPGNRPTED